MNSTKENLNLYLCGPTVYNDVHIGNLRPIIVFDFLISIWEFFGQKVNFLHNITDIDDKIIEKSINLQINEAELANNYFQEYLKILEKFNVKSPTKIIKITDAIDKIINYISLLEKKGATYFDNRGDLIFDTSKFKDYGSISSQKIEFLLQNNTNRRSENDFVLWKKTTRGQLFESPFGKGRPGWHTECAALIFDYFKGEQIDIHGGGQDLIFPHHENENAQHFILRGEELAKKWLRVGIINLNGKKMSKSEGNIFLAKDFCKKNNPDVLRNIFLTTNLKSPIDLTEKLLENHRNIIKNYRKSYFDFLVNPGETNWEKVKEILNFFSKNDFSRGNFLISELLRKKENATLAQVFKVLRFNFAKQKLGNEDKLDLKNWHQFLEEKKYKKADEIREKLWKKFIFS
ncbi:cysteine--tRNA ligase [Mycoplasma sp. 'Moose RK']|uniref:cysteine--tRNA ligase n=1 Tax=Mycoplasma sp. 'Moose RK' TaxID=2780095 RepID=UPI0035BE8A47